MPQSVTYSPCKCEGLSSIPQNTRKVRRGDATSPTGRWVAGECLEACELDILETQQRTTEKLHLRNKVEEENPQPM